MLADATTTPHPWEQQPGESAKAFRAFACYRDLGARRSLDEVCRQLYPTQTGRKRDATGRAQVWSTTHQWVARARAWDAEQDRLSRQEAAVEEAERALGPWLDPGQSLADAILHLRHRITEAQVAVQEAVAKERQRVVRLVRGWGHPIGARDSLERTVLEGRDPGPSG
jgi:hypothetical protein